MSRGGKREKERGKRRERKGRERERVSEYIHVVLILPVDIEHSQ